MNKILIFVGGLGGGGAERVFVNIGNELHKRKYDVEFVVTGKKINENYKLNDQIKVDYISSKKKNKRK